MKGTLVQLESLLQISMERKEGVSCVRCSLHSSCHGLLRVTGGKETKCSLKTRELRSYSHYYYTTILSMQSP